jgi:hypothetical protein
MNHLGQSNSMKSDIIAIISIASTDMILQRVFLRHYYPPNLQSLLTLLSFFTVLLNSSPCHRCSLPMARYPKRPCRSLRTKVHAKHDLQEKQHWHQILGPRKYAPNSDLPLVSRSLHRIPWLASSRSVYGDIFSREKVER